MFTLKLRLQFEYPYLTFRRVTKVNKNSGYKVHWMMDSYEYGRLESVDTHPGDLQPGNSFKHITSVAIYFNQMER